MIFTSYFAKIQSLPDNIIPVSICGKAPEWFNGLQYRKLAPKYSFFVKWKENHDNDYYIEHFHDEVLRNLDAIKILHEISDLRPCEIKARISSKIWRDPNVHIALVCYEKPDDFCHRHLVADWLSRNGVECKEYCFDTQHEEEN